VLFVDVRGFTSLAEQLQPADVAARLNRFYDLASRAIFLYDGTLDKLVGDQVMAFFGAPIDCQDHAGRAVRAAVEIIDNLRTSDGGAILRVGAGISSGEAFVGNVGGAAVADYTVLGDTVNIAARLQGEAAPGEILISDETYAQVTEQFPNATRRELLLKGKSDPVIAWQVGTNAPTRGR